MTAAPHTAAAHTAAPDRRAPEPSGVRHGGRRGGRRAAIAVLAAVLLATLGPLAGTDALPALAATTPTPAPTSASVEPGLVAAPLSHGIVADGDSLAVSVGLTAGDAATPATTASIAIGTEPITTREQLTQWLASPDAARTPVTVGAADLGALSPGSRGSVVVRVPADDPVLTDRVPGVYPVLARASVAGTALASASVFVIPSDQTAEVAVVVPITAPPSTAGLLTRDELAALTADDGALTTALAGIQGTDAIVAIDPAIPAAIRVLGSAAPPSALTWLARFDALPNARLALQFGDADPAAQAAAGVAPPLAPTSLAAFVDPAGFEDSPDPEPTPNPTTTANADQDATQDPTLAELLDVGATTPAYWPEQLTGDVLAALGADGALTLVDTTAIATSAAPVPVRGRSGDAQVLIADAELSAALSAAATEPDSLDRAATLAQASGLRQLTVSGPTILVALARDTSRPAVSLRAAIDAAQSTPGAGPLGLDVLVAQTPVEVGVVDGAIPTSRVDAVSVLLDGEQRLAQFATILADPALLTGAERAEVLQLLSLEWAGQDAEWAQALSAHADQTQQTLHAVGIVPPSPIQLVAADAEIPVGIRNDLPYPVTVTLHAHSDDLRLEVAESTAVSIGPQQSVRAGLPVKARVGSGAVTVELALTSPTGVRIGSPQELEVNVRADWESIGLIVLGVLAAAFLALGVVRTVRRLRRRDATGAGDAAESGPPSASDGESQ